jgi:hypothetical protein
MRNVGDDKASAVTLVGTQYVKKTSLNLVGCVSEMHSVVNILSEGYMFKGPKRRLNLSIVARTGVDPSSNLVDNQKYLIPSNLPNKLVPMYVLVVSGIHNFAWEGAHSGARFFPIRGFVNTSRGDINATFVYNQDSITGPYVMNSTTISLPNAHALLLWARRLLKPEDFELGRKEAIELNYVYRVNAAVNQGNINNDATPIVVLNEGAHAHNVTDGTVLNNNAAQAPQPYIILDGYMGRSMMNRMKTIATSFILHILLSGLLSPLDTLLVLWL